MLELYKRDTFLTNYKKLTLNERINTKYIDFRAEAYTVLREFEDNYLVEFLPKIDR